ncbi:MAG: hypothetical protein CVU84_06725 [Firmicutes bacterium HGW-Firmicutes-1]|jgi:nitrogen regulatory protein PII|nr:MAG: hypothetical protein CVU84_06725 [Firmicutes bacterium HGW-Firmicutes-1]
MYLMVIVISNTEKLKSIIKALKNIDIKGSIVIDSMGTTNIDNSYLGYRPAIESTLRTISEVTNYKKTLLSIVDSEEKVLEAMDMIEALLGNNMKKTNTGIMFTIPMSSYFSGQSNNIKNDSL